MQVIDWKQLKDGDKFKVKGTPTRDTMYTLGLTYPAATLYVKKGQRFALAGAEEYTFGNSMIGASAHKQEVMVIDPTDKEDQTELIMGCNSRVGDNTGTDPEIFVVKGLTKRLFPAYKFLPTQKDAMKTGPKYDSYAYGSYGIRNYAYRDGFAGEYYTQPSGCHAYLIDDIRGGLIKVLDAAKAVDKSAELTLKNTFKIGNTTMGAATDDEVALGCSPSLNAYNDNPVLPKDAKEFRFRFAGGHVHLATAYKTKLVDMVKGCDIFAAIPGVAIFQNFDSPIRRQFYGRAGEYRAPKHGLEYRVLSNAWLGHPKVTHLFLNLVRIGAKLGKAGYAEGLGMTTDQAREIINYCDVKSAREFVLKQSKVFHTLLKNDGATTTSDAKNLKAFELIVAEGVEALFPDFADVAKNWKFGKAWATHSDGSTEYWGAAYTHLKAA